MIDNSYHMPPGIDAVSEAAGLPDPDALRSESSKEIMKRALASIREHLDMEVSFVTELSGDRLFFRTVEGDAESFNIREGADSPLEETICKKALDGRAPKVIPDVARNEAVRNMSVTRKCGIGSYISVPLRFKDGYIYGTMCCMSHTPNPLLRERDLEFMGVIARLLAEQLEREQLEARNQHLQLRSASIDALLAALEARDGYTGEHSEAVVEFAVAVARRMETCEETCEQVELLGLLHDLGKIGIPDEILNKQGPLDEQEWVVMRTHPLVGERIVASVESLSHLAPLVRSEHERWDGRGYPDGLSGEQIPLPDRIVFACDSLHAMISDRPYRKAMRLPEALAELQRNAGTQFCPEVVSVLVESAGELKLAG